MVMGDSFSLARGHLGHCDGGGGGGVGGGGGGRENVSSTSERLRPRFEWGGIMWCGLELYGAGGFEWGDLRMHWLVQRGLGVYGVVWHG